MRERCESCGLVPNEPRFQKEAAMFADDLSHCTGTELSELFGCSPQIGEQNRQRFSVFGSDEAELMPAILAYNGQAYKHLKAHELGFDQLLWANGHLMVSSCLYGLLRALDGINTYRMEGGLVLPSTNGVKVNDYWKPLLTEALIEAVNGDDGTLVYLDTEEYRLLFDWPKVVESVKSIIEPKFQVMKNGRLTTPSVWAKTCRGAMARYIIDNRIDNPAQLQDFTYEGFCYSSAHSSDGRPVFVRQ